LSTGERVTKRIERTGQEKDPLLALRKELSLLKKEVEEATTSSSERKEVSNNLNELKKRMDKSELELKAIAEAMKTTLLDVRTLVQDLDNPFNLLQEMGVDKLVEKAVEHVEDEVNRQKREEAKRRMAKGETEPGKMVSLQGAPSPIPGSETRPVSAREVTPYPSSLPTGIAQHSPPEDLKKRMDRAEEAIKELTETTVSILQDICSLIALSAQKRRGGGYGYRSGALKIAEKRGLVSDMYGGLKIEGLEGIEEANYEAYVSLVGDYLVLRFGQKGAEELLLEGLYRGWASPNVVRDVIDNISARARNQNAQDDAISFGLSFSNTDIEDKILLTSLLRNLDKPVAEWEEPTHLFLLLALVKRTRESKLTRT